MAEKHRSCRTPMPVKKRLLNTLVVKKGTTLTENLEAPKSIADATNTLPQPGTNTIALWDAVGPCSLALCELRYDCPHYVSMPAENPPPCAVQTNYLQYIYKTLVARNAKMLTQRQLDRIGYHLLPLYGHLIKFKMVEYTLTLDGGGVHGGIIVKNARTGGATVHPIYREIRATLGAIESIWNSIGLSKLGIDTPKKPTTKDLFEWGDPDYVDNLTNGAFESNESESADAV